jgi:hypothetical protein
MANGKIVTPSEVLAKNKNHHTEKPRENPLVL